MCEEKPIEEPLADQGIPCSAFLVNIIHTLLANSDDRFKTLETLCLNVEVVVNNFRESLSITLIFG